MKPFLQEASDSSALSGWKHSRGWGVILGQVFELWLRTPLIAFRFGLLGRCGVCVAGFRGVSQGLCRGIDRTIVRIG